MKKIAILASGNGTNAEAIIRHFAGHPRAKVALIGSNKDDAYVLERAKKHDIQAFTFSKKELENGSVQTLLLVKRIDLIVLAGFMLKIPDSLVRAFPRAMVNIHPALLPKYGGKGMYGMHVHKAVKDSGDRETGITIHWVNERYDEGEIILQEQVEVLPDDTPEQIAEKVHQLEYKYYPKVIETLI